MLRSFSLNPAPLPYGPWSLVLTVYLLLRSPACNLVRERDRVGGRFPAGLWQQRTRGSIYKIDVVLSAGPGYCGNHIPIFTKNKTHDLPLLLPTPRTRASSQCQSLLFLHIFLHQIYLISPQYLPESVSSLPP